MKPKTILLLTLHDPLYTPPLETVMSGIFNVKCHSIIVGLKLGNNTLTLQYADIERQVSEVVGKHNIDAIITLDTIVDEYIDIFKKLCCRTTVIEYSSLDLDRIARHVKVLRSLGYDSIAVTVLAQQEKTIDYSKIRLPVKVFALISLEKEYITVSIILNKQSTMKLKFEGKVKNIDDVVKAIATLIAIGLLNDSLEETLSKDVEVLADMAKYNLTTSPLLYLNVLVERLNVLDNMYKALELIEKNSSTIGRYIPEVQTNIVMSLPAQYVKELNDIAGVKGRIIRYGSEARPVGPVLFGASKHMASLLKIITNIYPDIRSAINIKFSPKIINKAQELGYVVVECEIKHCSKESSQLESINQSFNECLQSINVKPDIVFHKGCWGIEPLIIVLGKSALDVVKKTLKLLRVVEEG